MLIYFNDILQIILPQNYDTLVIIFNNNQTITYEPQLLYIFLKKR